LDTPEERYLLRRRPYLLSEGKFEAGLKVLTKYIGSVAHVPSEGRKTEVLERVRKEKSAFWTASSQAPHGPGDGAIDFARFSRASMRAIKKGWMVVEAEQDPAKANR
jgi:inosose dehydratase